MTTHDNGCHDCWRPEPRPNVWADPPPCEWPIPENVILAEN